jgi:hypothetical protein
MVFGLNDDQDYQYRVRAFNNDGFSGLSNEISVRTVLGLEDLLELEGVSAYPNPSEDLFSILIDNRVYGNYELNVHDHTGRVIRTEQFIKSGKMMRKELDMSTLPAGLYFVSVQTENAADILRLIKR